MANSTDSLVNPRPKSVGTGFNEVEPKIRSAGQRWEGVFCLIIITPAVLIRIGMIFMNQSYSSEIEKAILNHLLYAVRISLGIAWKLTVSALTLAIVLGMTAGPAAQSGSPSLNEAHPVRVEREDNVFRISTQIPSGKDTLQIELVDPRGKKHLFLTYGKNGLAYSFTQYTDALKVGYSKRPGGGELVHVRTPANIYNVGLHGNGESNVTVVHPGVRQEVLGEIWVSPDGKRRPESEASNAR